MPNRGKFTIEFKVKVIELAKIIREDGGKFDGSNTNMNEVGMGSTRLELGNKWLMCFPY